jgi:hypothetical protein
MPQTNDRFPKGGDFLLADVNRIHYNTAVTATSELDVLRHHTSDADAQKARTSELMYPQAHVIAHLLSQLNLVEAGDKIAFLLGVISATRCFTL